LGVSTSMGGTTPFLGSVVKENAIVSNPRNLEENNRVEGKNGKSSFNV
jgi:hypothetical protein